MQLIYCLGLSGDKEVTIFVPPDVFLDVQDQAKQEGRLLLGWLERVHGRSDFRLPDSGPAGYDGSLLISRTDEFVAIKPAEEFWDKPSRISLSLYGLLYGLTNLLYDRDLMMEYPAVVQLESMPRSGDWKMTATFNDDFCKWYDLRFNGQKSVPESASAMQQTDLRLNGGEKSWDYSFIRADSSEKGFHLYVAHDCCCFGSSSWPPNISSCMGCHNVDTPKQQLTILTGVAAITDLYYREKGLLK